MSRLNSVLLGCLFLLLPQQLSGLGSPPDPAVPGWRVARTLCAECGDGSTCGEVAQSASVHFRDGRTASFGPGDVLTCYKKDYSVDFSATFGGRCVPALPEGLEVESFCEAVQPANVSGKRLSKVIFQALVSQDTRCAPCCDGHSACSGELVCRTAGQNRNSGGICVHPDQQDECAGQGQDLQDVLCDSCLPDVDVSRRILTGHSEPGHGAPGPTTGGGLPVCFQLAILEKIEDIINYLKSQPWSGRNVIKQLEGILHTIEALVAANFLRGAWGANHQATISVVVANWRLESYASTQVFKEMIKHDPHTSAAIYTASAFKSADLGANVLAASFLAAPAAQSHVFLLASANARIYSAGTMWGLSYKSDMNVSLSLFARAVAAANKKGVDNLIGAAVVAQYYTGVSVKAADFAQHAASAGVRQEVVARMRTAWHA